MKNTGDPDRFVKNEMRRFSKVMRVHSQSVDRMITALLRSLGSCNEEDAGCERSNPSC